MAEILYNKPCLDWTLDLSCGCKKMTFTETTCFASEISCCDGYGVSNNYDYDYPDSTAFNFVFPDGTAIMDYDPSYMPDPTVDGGMTFDFSVSDLSEGNTYDPATSKLSCFMDGVYTMTYIQYQDDNGENVVLQRTTRKFLMTCNVTACLKAAMLKAAGECSCNIDDIMKRIQKVRMLLEVAQYQFNDELYSCAQESVDKAGKLCRNICLDC